MPHSRERYAARLINRALSHAPIVGVMGQRQVGKTTLLEGISSEYRTLDQRTTREEAEADPEFFIQNRPPKFAIDEAQFCPGLFPALKEHVRTHKRTGQFILSGSVRFTSRKPIRESLTGRIANVEVLPFTHAESHSRPLPRLLEGLAAVRKQAQLERLLASPSGIKAAEFESYLETGGLPGICFFRAREVRADRWRSQLDTLLTRDIRLVQETSLPFEALRDLLEFLAQKQGSPFIIKDAVKATQISAVTVKRLLASFEALFLIRPVRSTGDQSKGSYFLEDQGMASWLTRKTLDSSTDVIRGLYANLRQEFFYRPDLNGRIRQYRTKHDVEIPLVFHTEDWGVGILATLEKTPRPKTLSSALAYLKKHPRHSCVIAYAGADCIQRTDRLLLIPYWMLLG